MIYILTPYLNDFKNTCDALGLPYHAGRSNHDVVFVHNVDVIMGLMIHKHDKIIEGARIHEFDLEMLNRIKLELAIARKR